MFKKIKNKLTSLNMSYKNVIIFAVCAGIYTGIVNLIPIFKDTSIRDIAVSFEWWILFAILIIINSKSYKDAAIKTFIFFLISQPLVYLVESPFLGFEVFSYYKYWFIWTILTIPGSIIAYYMKKENILSSIILSVATIFIAYSGMEYFKTLQSTFPNHLLTVIIAALLIIFLPLLVFRDKKNYIITFLITIGAIGGFILYDLLNKSTNVSTITYTMKEDSNWECNMDDNEIFSIEKINSLDFKITATGKASSSAIATCNSDKGNISINITYSNGNISLEDFSY